MISIEEMNSPEWNAERKRLQDALLQAANELTTFTGCSRTEIRENGLRVVVQVETFDKRRMQ